MCEPCVCLSRPLPPPKKNNSPRGRSRQILLALERADVAEKVLKMMSSIEDDSTLTQVHYVLFFYPFLLVGRGKSRAPSRLHATLTQVLCFLFSFFFFFLFFFFLFVAGAPAAAHAPLRASTPRSRSWRRRGSTWPRAAARCRRRCTRSRRRASLLISFFPPIYFCTRSRRRAYFFIFFPCFSSFFFPHVPGGARSPRACSLSLCLPSLPAKARSWGA